MGRKKITTRKKKKISYDEWLGLLSEESGVDVENVSLIWQAFLRLFIKKTRFSENSKFYIPDFGIFSIAVHKGHPLNLGLKDYTEVSDYEVFKFKPHDMYKKQVLQGNLDPLETKNTTS